MGKDESADAAKVACRILGIDVGKGFFQAERLAKPMIAAYYAECTCHVTGGDTIKTLGDVFLHTEECAVLVAFSTAYREQKKGSLQWSRTGRAKSRLFDEIVADLREGNYIELRQPPRRI